MSDGDGIAIGILIVLRQQARYPYVKDRLGRAIDYLKGREIPGDVREVGSHVFIDGFDHYLEEAIDNGCGDAPHA